jgi:ribosomal protein S18 acetylase RimI-like enzyme
MLPNNAHYFTTLVNPSESQIKQIFSVYLASFLQSGEFTKEELTTYFQKKILPRFKREELVPVVIIDEKIVGFATYENLGKTSYYLAELSILPEYQRMGFGKKLIFSILERGATQIFLLTAKTNFSTQSFYEHIGFQPSDFKHPDYPKGFIPYELKK